MTNEASFDDKTMTEVEDFTQRLNSNFICVICEGVLVKPMCCREGHSCCDTCIRTWLATKSECPVDRGLLTVATIFRNRPLENVRIDLIIKLK